jgi:hypothetical protein
MDMAHQMSVDIGVAIAFAGLLLAGVQMWLGHKKQKFDNTLQVFDRLHERQAREDRFRVRQILEKATASPEGFEGLTPEERASLSSISSLFGFAGLLAQQDKIDMALLMSSFGHSIRYNHDRLGEYRAYRLSRKGGSSDTMWTHFDWIAAKARAYEAQ